MAHLGLLRAAPATLESMVSKLLQFLAKFLHHSGTNKTSGLFIALPGRAGGVVEVGTASPPRLRNLSFPHLLQTAPSI